MNLPILFIAFIAAFLNAGAITAAQVAPESTMTRVERVELIDRLLQTEKEFLQAVEGLNEQQSSFKPGPDRWSVGEVAEHIVLAEALLFDGATEMLKGQPDPGWSATLAKTERIRRAIPDRSTKVDAPAAIRPTQKMTRAQVMARFKEQRARSLAFARENELSLKTYTGPNPFFGPLNAHQWVLYIPLHHERHNQQIAEIKASPDFPR